MTHVWWRRWLLSAAVVSCVVAGRLGAQCTWQVVHTDPPIIGYSQTSVPGFAFDSARGFAVLFQSPGFGGGQYASAYEWDGSLWHQRVASNALQIGGTPHPNEGSPMVFDSVRSQTVLFAGSETWEWDGIAWRRRATTGPGSGLWAGAYDSARNRVVLVGGSGSQTWEWDGAAWTQRLVAGPPPRNRPAMAYDAGRGKVVLFGGGGLHDTWEWDGTVWTQSPATGPTYDGYAMCYDSARQRLVLVGGYSQSFSPPPPPNLETWEWVGSTWMQIPVVGPPTRGSIAMTFDSIRGRTVLFGGFTRSPPGGYEDTWEWDGIAWAQMAPTDPSAQWSHAMVYDTDNDRALLVGVSGGSPSANPHVQTWAYASDRWARIAATGPSVRSGQAMAYDQARHQAVLFGGRGVPSDTNLSDTWVFDGADWTQRNVAGPPARWGHAAAYDPVRQRVVLFGGKAGDPYSPTYLDDAWEWDGQAWTQLVAPGPSARAGHVMTYDGQRHRVVLVGGFAPDDVNSKRETWEWDGDAWEERALLGEPGFDGVSDGAIAYDALRQRTVVFGGSFHGAALWEYDGAAWTQRMVNAGVWREQAPMVYYPIHSAMLLFGGFDGSRARGDTLELPSGLAAPTIQTQPLSRTVHVGDTVSFSVVADGVGPFRYQWGHAQYLGVVDGPAGASGTMGGGGVVSGATSPTLTITGVQTSDMFQGGNFYCSVSNPCTTVNSQMARLVVLPPCGTADFDGDGMIGTDADIEAFFACLGGSCCAACYAGGADFNADGDVGTDQDIDSFFRVLAGGSC